MPDRCPYETEELAQLYAKHRSTYKIGALTGHCGTTVARWLRARDIELQGLGGCNNPLGYGGKSGKRPKNYYLKVSA